MARAVVRPRVGGDGRRLLRRRAARRLPQAARLRVAAPRSRFFAFAAAAQEPRLRARLRRRGVPAVGRAAPRAAVVAARLSGGRVGAALGPAARQGDEEQAAGRGVQARVRARRGGGAGAGACV